MPQKYKTELKKNPGGLERAAGAKDNKINHVF